MAGQTRQINQLVALRMGEVWPPMLARAIATLDHLAQGRLTLNIISSDLPGLKESNDVRYERSSEVIQILQKLWVTNGPLDWKGTFYNFSLPNCEPAKPYQQNGGPLLYFGGISPAAQELCAKHCDVFLMWPETEDRLAATMQSMSALAARHGRVIDFGLRIHIIVRETETAARAAAKRLISKLISPKAGRSERGRWTRRARAFCGRTHCERKPTRIFSSRSTFGPASVSRAAVAAVRLSAIRIKCSPK